jgi:hypothetical protein
VFRVVSPALLTGVTGEGVGVVEAGIVEEGAADIVAHLNLPMAQSMSSSCMLVVSHGAWGRRI